MLGIIFGQYPLQQLDYEDNPLISDALYDSCARVAWAIALAWIIVACLNDYGGIATRFLNLSFWRPISRLSYCIYLLHVPIQNIYLSSVRAPLFFSEFGALQKFCGDILMTILAAIVWSLAFEYPVMNLLKVFIKKSTVNKMQTMRQSDLQEETRL